MIKYLSPTVLAAVLRASSAPVFSIQLALTSLLTRREANDAHVHAPAHVATHLPEGASRA